MATGIHLRQRSDETLLNRSWVRPRFEDPRIEEAWMVERLETFKRVNRRSLIFVTLMCFVFAVLDLAFLNPSLSVTITRIGLFVFIAALLAGVNRITNVRTGDRFFAASSVLGLGVVWFQVFLTLPANQLIEWWLVTLAMFGVVFMVVAEAALWARLVVAACLMLFGVMVPLRVGMSGVDTLLGFNHIVVIYAAGWVAAWQVETSRRLAFVRQLAVEEERGRTVGLLRNILPKPIADRLLRSPETIAEHHPSVTVLFADIVGFTPWASNRNPTEVVEVLDQIFTAFDALCDKHGVEKIKTIGDAYMAVGGIPVADGPTAPSVVRLGLEMLTAAENILLQENKPLQLRIGVHEGPAVAGVIGRRKFLYDLWGDTVNIAARVESHGMPGRVQITEAVVRQLHDEFEMEERGEIDIKGKGLTSVYFVRAAERS